MTKTIVITGASDGIGAAAAKQLVAAGNRLLIVGRSAAKTEAAAKASGADAFFITDFQELDQVRQLAKDLRQACDRIDVLANNAGGIFTGPVRTVDGFERTFQINHLAPFLLTHELLDLLLSSKAAVVNTSSVAARMTPVIDLNNLDLFTNFGSSRAYSNAKFANIAFTRELHRRYHAQGLSAVAFHPGVVATNFAAQGLPIVRWFYRSWIGHHSMITADQGGANLAHFASGQPDADWMSGQYYDNHWRISGTNQQAYDDQLVEAHWERSAALLGI
jgi:NAD(P)-dependent dehydrogenase (short-subunit alcohol dehydrogenase family)